MALWSTLIKTTRNDLIFMISLDNAKEQFLQDKLKNPKSIINVFSPRFASDLFVWCPENGTHRTRLLTAMYPLTLSAATENLADLVTLSLERSVFHLQYFDCLKIILIGSEIS